MTHGRVMTSLTWSTAAIRGLLAATFVVGALLSIPREVTLWVRSG